MGSLARTSLAFAAACVGAGAACRAGPSVPGALEAPAAAPVHRGPPGEDASGRLDPLVDVPIVRLASGHLAARMDLGALQEQLLLLDTGASMTVITPDTRDLLKIPADAGRRAQAKAAGGSAGRVRLVPLPPVSLGGHRIEGLQAAVLSLEHLTDALGEAPAGVLGQNFFALHVVEFDLARGRLRLYPGDADPSWPEALPLEPVGRTGLYAIRVRIEPGALELPAVIDLGAGRSVLNRAAARAAGLALEASEEAGAPVETIEGASRGAIRATSHALDRIEVGSRTIPSPRVLVADLPVFRVLRLARRPAMILGFDQLDGHVVGLDLGRRRLYVSKVGRGGSGPAGARTRGPADPVAPRDPSRAVDSAPRGRSHAR